MKLLIFIIMIFSLNTNAQVSGTYFSVVNGDNVEMELNEIDGQINGTMEDSKQEYTVVGTNKNGVLSLKASESTYGIVLFIQGKVVSQGIQMEADVDIYGVRQKAFSALFTKSENGNTNNQSVISNSSNNVSIPKANAPAGLKGKSIDPAIIGVWREESHYSSGYGSNFSGSTYTYTGFNADHTMMQYGSKVTMSGENYSGSAGGIEGGQVMPNIWFYTENGKVMCIMNNNGQLITTPIGSYFIENGKMLFTQVNTNKKIIYYKM